MPGICPDGLHPPGPPHLRHRPESADRTYPWTRWPPAAAAPRRANSPSGNNSRTRVHSPESRPCRAAKSRGPPTFCAGPCPNTELSSLPLNLYLSSQGQRGRFLRRVRVLVARVDLQFSIHLFAKLGLRQHPEDGVLNQPDRLFGSHALQALLHETAGATG